MKILFTGGGTGGHIFPIIAIVREIRRIYLKEDIQFFYLGPRDVFASIVLSQEGIKPRNILAGKVRRYLTFLAVLKNIADICFKIPIGFVQAFVYIFFLNPDIIFSTGGYGSFPAVIVGRILQTPSFLHESDTVAGLTNRIFSKFSLNVFTSFPETKQFPKEKIILIGIPIRREILEGTKEEAEKLFRLTGQKPVILILGGSQGAQRINDMLLAILPEILKEFEIIHQVGERNYVQFKRESDTLLKGELKNYYHIFGFLKEQELKQAYKAADLIVSRAGAGTIFEIAALAKPSILVPLPEAARGHQVSNAYAYSNSGAGLVLEEENLTPYFFLEKLKFLLSQPEELEKMRENAKKFARPEAAKEIAQYIIEYFK